MSFREVIGQENAIGLLKKSITANRLPHAYLFSGDEGIGKNLVALNFAKAINCEHGNLDACESCPSCLKIAKGNHPDIHILAADEAGSIKIELIRQLQRDISLKAYEARQKVFIINDAHTLTIEASNALLKILEEPPQMCLFVLISSKTEMLLPTIVSRCQILRFSALNKERLKEILRKNYNLDEAQSHYLCYFYEGRLGSCLRHKDEGILENKNQVIDKFTRDRGAAPEYNDKEEIKAQIEVLLKWFRDIYLIKSGCAHAQLINIDRRNDLLTDMARFSYAELDEVVANLADVLMYLDQNINPRLLISNLRSKLWTRSRN